MLIKRAVLLLTLSGMAAFNTSADTLTWSAGASGTWDATSVSWVDGVPSPTAWVDGNAAVFSQAAGSTTSVVIDGNVSVSGTWAFGTPGDWGDDWTVRADFAFSGGTVTFSAPDSRIQLNRVNEAHVSAHLITADNQTFAFRALGYNVNNDLYLTGGGRSETTFEYGGRQFGNSTWWLGFWDEDISVMFNAGTYVMRQLTTFSTHASYVGRGNTDAVAVNLLTLEMLQGAIIMDNPNAVFTQAVWHNIAQSKIGQSNNNGAFEVRQGVASFEGGVAVMNGNGNGAGLGLITVSGGTLNVNPDSIFNSGTNGILLGHMDNNSGKTDVDGKAMLSLSGGAVNTHGIYFGGSNEPRSGRWAATSTAALLVSGGTLTLGAGGIQKDSIYAMGENLITLSGGVVRARDSFAIDAALAVTLSDANGGVTFDTNGSQITINGEVNGAGGLAKAGNGTLLLGGANTYAGDTIVSAGALQLDNVNALGGVADLSVWTGAMVNLNYSGTAVIDSLLLDGVTISNLVIGQGYNHTELNTALGAVIFSGAGLLSVSAIPEPSALTLLLTGAALLAVMRRRR